MVATILGARSVHGARIREQAEPCELEQPDHRCFGGLRREVLEQRADAAALRRGADYLTAGRVHVHRRSLLVMRAQVKGQRSYLVELYLLKGGDGVPVGGCTCPAGRLHRFCKHCAAAALRWLPTGDEQAALGLCGEVGLLALEALLDQGAARQVLHLSEQALQVLEDFVAPDLSEAELSPVLRRLQGLHLRAARAARPDQVALAERLFDWELRSERGVFRGAAAAYAEVLGGAGLSHYRGLAHSAGAAVGNGRRRRRLSYIMDTLRFFPGSGAGPGDGVTDGGD